MIPPSEHWCIQIDVTNACNRKCSNCTRSLSHTSSPFFMSTQQFSSCVAALEDFPTKSAPSKSSPHKLVGIMGGEPLLHPQFDILACILSERISKKHRGLWTGLNWKKTQYEDIIRINFDKQFIHNNTHDSPSYHSPVLVASKDVVLDSHKRKQLINDCWLQQRWSSCMTPKGFFFCEVAAALDTIFGGPGGLPIEPGCWEQPISDFQYQIDSLCSRCGVCLNLQGRLDNEEIDDISYSNLQILKDHSPRIKEMMYVIYDRNQPSETIDPWVYKR